MIDDDIMEPDQPSPIEPLDYASPAKTPSPMPRWMRFVPSKRTRRIIRLIYLSLCFIGFVFVFRFALHYRQTLEDAMKQK